MERPLMQCDQIAELLPELIDSDNRNLTVERHVETCLRCQAEVARYRRLLRAMAMLRTRYLEPSPNALAQTLAAIESDMERHAIRLVLSGRRLAVAGAIGGTVATAATVAALMSRNRRRSVRIAS
jgi:anti-sigma factor RsiW